MTEKDILEHISQEDIMTKYFGEWELGKNYTNPYRKNNTDRKPGCWFAYRGEILYFIDFGNEVKNINCFEMCKLYYKCNYSQALIHIDNDFKLNFSIENLLFAGNREFNLEVKNQSTDNNLGKIIVTEQKPLEYNFIYQDFQPWDITFWKRFKYNKKLIDCMKIRSVDRVYVDGKLFSCSSKYNPIYTYSDSKGEFKLYQPYESKFKKWRTIRAILEGFDLLQSSEVLFITSSYKDVGVLKLLGFQAIAPPSETSYNLIVDNIDFFKRNYKHIYVFHNNDETGKHFSLKLTRELGLNYINIPNTFKPKDPSDFVEIYDLNKLWKLIYDKFKRDSIDYVMEEHFSG